MLSLFLCRHYLSLLFFFQAEDGIRDLTVTGVQTCALPISGGVDGFILETFSDVEELHAALRAVQSLSDLPIIAQMTIGDDGLTHYGTGPETFAQQLTEWGADVIGVNCSVGPAGVLEAVEKMVKVTDRPISGVPNAGLPRDVGDRKIYLASPEYMASYARRMIEAGARLVGGCCGTTPRSEEHTSELQSQSNLVCRLLLEK